MSSLFSFYYLIDILMQCCKKCFQDDWIVTEVKHYMFDIDGSNLEELPICPLEKSHNTGHDHYDHRTMQTFTHDYLTDDETIELPVWKECLSYVEWFEDYMWYSIIEWSWEDVWKIITWQDNIESDAKKYFNDFIIHWFDCIITGDSNNISWERCNGLEYSEHFEIVDSYVNKLPVVSVEYMAFFWLLITLSNDFSDYMNREHELVLLDIIS